MRESGYDPSGGPFSVRFVTIGSQAKAEEFCGQHGMAAYCIGDADKRTYAAMGLEQYNLLRLFTDPALQKRRAENRAAGFKQNWGATKLQDGAQLPGAAIVDADGNIRWIHRGAHPGDLPPVGEMLERARELVASQQR
ncbi:MAG TPA: AhpC/TSA family protein [Candidatus Elarobacter sp.]|nr:AhpC/TSA family protein [Candidatus Elarobacter sp.]